MTESQANTINANLTPLPDKVGVDGLEDKWRGVWDEGGVYKFRNTRDRKAVYSIDTPPPTVSGHLHVGHVFSYTHTDIIARFKRMNGFDVFYPLHFPIPDHKYSFCFRINSNRHSTGINRFQVLVLPWE